MIVLMKQMYHQNSKLIDGDCQRILMEGSLYMTLVQKRWIIIFVIIIVGFLLGRLAVWAFTNLLLGGTLFGGNFL